MPEYRLIEDIIEPYMREKKYEKKATTLKNEAGYCKRLELFFGRDFISDIKGSTVHQYRQHRVMVGGVQEDSAERELKLACAATNYAIKEWDFDIVNPFLGRTISAKGAKARRARPVRKIEQSENLKVLTWCREQPDPFFGIFADMFSFCHETGLRMSEMLELKWWQLREDVIEMTPDDQKSNRHGERIMNATALLIVSRQPEGSENVFQFNDEPITRHKIQWGVKKVRAGTGIQFVFSDTRKSRGQHMLDNGQSVEDVQYQLGHSDLRVTQKYYLKSPVDRLRKSVQPIECGVSAVDNSDELEPVDKKAL